MDCHLLQETRNAASRALSSPVPWATSATPGVFNPSCALRTLKHTPRPTRLLWAAPVCLMAPPRYLWTSQINHLKWNLNSLHHAPHLSFPEVLGPNPSSGPPFLLPLCPRAVQRACYHPHQRLSLAHLHQRPWSKPSATAGLDGCQPARGSPSFCSCPAAPFLSGAPPPPAHSRDLSKVRHRTMTLS